VHERAGRRPQPADITSKRFIEAARAAEYREDEAVSGEDSKRIATAKREKIKQQSKADT
jgi:hypothetical protein